MSGLPIDDHDAAIYTVGHVAQILGVQPAFLRRLDTERVVQPARSDGGQRRYSRADIDQVERVSGLAAEGHTLAGIRQIIALETELAHLRAEVTAERTKREHRHP